MRGAFRLALIVIVSVGLISTLVIMGLSLIDRPGSNLHQDVAPMTYFKTIHHYGCWWILTDDTCYTEYLYVASGSEEDVTSQVMTTLGKDDAVEAVRDEGSPEIVVTIKGMDDAQDTRKQAYLMRFITQADPSAPGLTPTFVPSACKGNVDSCVEAIIQR